MKDDLLQTYDILERIGEGSGGVIYKAYHKRLQKTVVMKRIIDPGFGMDHNRQEVDILKNINHSYLPQVLDFFETDEGVFTVMNFIPGKSFQQLLREGARFSKEDLLKWSMQICSALNYLHTRKVPIIHGDIKPSNIMLKPDGDICLIDFNIAFYFNHNTVLGCTRGYSSPEQFWAVSSKQNRQDMRFVVDNKADIYSVGATLYHLATGNVRADHTHEIDIGRLASIIGWPFAQVIAKATALDPRMRYQSAYDMYQALKMVPGESQMNLQTRRKGKRKVAAAVVAAVIAITCICGAGIMYHKHKIDAYNHLISQAKACDENQDYTGMQDISQEAISLIEDDPEGYFWRDRAYYRNGQYQECCDLLENDIMKVGSNNDTVQEQDSIAGMYWTLGNGYAERKMYTRAIDVFEEMEQRYGDRMRAEHYRDYSIALANAGQTGKAEEKLERAKEKQEKGESSLPGFALTFAEGRILEEDGDNGEALDCFRDVVHDLKSRKRTEDENKILHDSYMRMGNIYEDMGDVSEAARMYNKAKALE